MTRISKFEELQCWHRAWQLANFIYDISGNGPFAKDYELRKQIRRSSGSAMHNIAEGFDASTDPEFVRFLKISRRSASEVQSQLYLAFDRKCITEAQLKTA
jgi:four helix bundle protein